MTSELELASFKDERWLFAYEAIYKKWILPTKSDLLLKSKYFMTLKKLNVSFYDSSRQVEEIKFPSVKKKNPKTYSKTDTTHIKTQTTSLLEKLRLIKKKKSTSTKPSKSTVAKITFTYIPGDE